METRFLSVLSIILFRVFFCKQTPLLKLGEVHFERRTTFLLVETNFIRYFLKWKQLFRIAETYFSISFTQLLQMDFLPSGNSAISLLVETIIGIRRKQFLEKELILAGGKLIFWIVQNIFFLSIFRRQLQDFFPSSGNVFFKEILISAQLKRILELKKAVNKKILFPIDKNSDSTSQNQGFVKKISFHYAESCYHRQKYLKKLVKNVFQQQERSYPIKNGFTLI